jgi:hypothetical protein
MRRVLPEKLRVPHIVKKSPAFVWNPNVHYRIQKRLLSVIILSENNTVPMPPHLTS